jgi:hypothetical protein
MITAKINTATAEDFTVLDSADNPLAGITLTEFTYKLYNPTGNESVLTVTFTELGDGNYRASFTPDAVGIWYLVVYHPTHFTTGKADTIQVSNYGLDDLWMLKDVYDTETGNWKLDEDNSEMIFYRQDGVTELMRFTIYTNAAGNPIRRVKQ